MEDEGIKSALELAMERVSKLPGLSAEEIARQREKEFRPLGEAIGHRYLEGILAAQELAPEAGRHEGDAGRIVRRGLVDSLSGAIGPENRAAAERALAGLLALAGKDEDGEAAAEWARLLGEYEERRAALAEEQAAGARKRLAKLGISGSAVVPVMERDEEYRRALEGVRREFEPALERLRSRLRREAEGAR
ncbi:MAG: hypothetical protein JXP48_13845 [Acidobacteria bacterium]|nr:hypothetical protein [Acidobacteriota bacterium]